jgi:hypothetical protein
MGSRIVGAAVFEGDFAALPGVFVLVATGPVFAASGTVGAWPHVNVADLFVPKAASPPSKVVRSAERIIVLLVFSGAAFALVAKWLTYVSGTTISILFPFPPGTNILRPVTLPLFILWLWNDSIGRLTRFTEHVCVCADANEGRSESAVNANPATKGANLLKPVFCDVSLF